MRLYYLKTRDQYNGRHRDRIKWLYEFVARYKSLLSCRDCKMKFAGREECCDFHHTRGEKVDTVSSMIAKHCSMKDLKDEIRKCDPLCANCHRTFHKNALR